MHTALSCRNLNKSFFAGDNEIIAVRNATLDVNKGELLMLVGPSGCGKTTLISLFAGILHYDSGELSVLGRDYRQMDSTQLLDFRARHIGFIFQSFNLLPPLSIAENVAIPLVIGGMHHAEANERARASLEDVGLGGRWRDFPNQLSGGQQQRVAIARGLVHEPALLVCDEPTSSLDHETGMHIIELMKQLQRRLSTTFIIVTHDNRIFPYADRIAHMDDGAITDIQTNPPQQAAQHG